MKTHEMLQRRQRAVVFVGLLLFGLILFMIQLWLFVMVLENLLAGRSGAAIPATLVSFIIFMVMVWMLRGIQHLSARR